MPRRETAPAPASADDSFVRAARREQLVRSAIDVIAERGVDGASVVRIAEHAGVSRGVVAYHFTGIDDLRDAVVDEVYRLGAELIRGPVASAPSPRDALSTFVSLSIDFYADYPSHLTALHEIFVAARRSRSRSRPAAPQHSAEIDDVSALLLAGHGAGQFRDFDVPVMAGSIRALLDAALAQLTLGIDVVLLRAELVAAVDAMTRKDGDNT